MIAETISGVRPEGNRMILSGHNKRPRIRANGPGPSRLVRSRPMNILPSTERIANPDSVRARIQRSIKVMPSGCWEWQLTRKRGGYGAIQIQKRRWLAHRASYEVHVGPIPDGLYLDHLCRNPPCVNPAHLEPVSFKENILRGESTAAKNARKTHCKHGHEFTAENTGWDTSAGRNSRYCRTCNINYHRNKRRGA